MHSFIFIRRVALLAGVYMFCFAMPLLSQVKQLSPKNTGKPRNIILMIGDGMGVTQVYAALTAANGELNFNRFRNIGFSKTYSATHYTTDSGAGGTALAIGKKTYNGAIGITKDTLSSPSILEYAEMKGLSTGLVSTSSITHATPASFIAHNKTRNDYEGIAADFLKTDIDVFIGGGLNNFTNRKDGRNLVNVLREKGYQVIFSTDSIRYISNGKLAALTAPEHHPSMVKGRGEMLPLSTATAINILSKNPNGFFLMVEGSQIDWGGHENNTDYIVTEVIDFDKAIGRALDFAEADGKTLVIVTADHETGGMSVVNGSIENGTVNAVYGTTNHSGVMVPVFAWGPGAELFQGIQENTEIFDKMMLLLGLTDTKTNPGK